MIFLYPYILLFIFPILLILIYLYFQGGNKVHFSAFKDVKKVFRFNSYWYKLYFVSLFIILGLFLIIISRPIELNSKEKIHKNGIDIEIVLDVSYSMIAKDVAPNRLEVAKEAIKGFLSKLQSDRVGIIVFAGKPFSSLPLNFDYDIVSKIVERINIDTINQNTSYMQGTAIGDALILAADSLDDENKREKVIILLTDGTANKGLSPESALAFLKQHYDFDIKIYTIGLGGDGETYIEVPSPFGGLQRIEIGGLDETVLKNIAQSTGGKYYRAKTKENLEEVFVDISKLEKSEIEVESYLVQKENYQIFLYLLGVFFLMFLGIKYRKNI